MAERTRAIRGTDQRDGVDAEADIPCDGKGPDCGRTRCIPCSDRAARDARMADRLPPSWDPVFFP